jgi:hypothetical protein
LFGIDSHERLMLTVCQPTKRFDPTWIVTSSGPDPRETVIAQHSCRHTDQGVVAAGAGAAAAGGLPLAAWMAVAQF